MSNSGDINSDTEKMIKLQIEFEKLEFDKDYVTDRREIETDQKPTIPCSGPFRVHLDKDKNYFYCVCGKSNSQPFCDGSHIGTEYKPLKFSIKNDVTWSLLCGCKQNDINSGPYCDGRHVNIEW